MSLAAVSLPSKAICRYLDQSVFVVSPVVWYVASFAGFVLINLSSGDVLSVSGPVVVALSIVVLSITSSSVVFSPTARRVSCSFGTPIHRWERHDDFRRA
jgi:hypothetical protein